jgi:hypothetical protein
MLKRCYRWSSRNEEKKDLWNIIPNRNVILSAVWFVIV